MPRRRKPPDAGRLTVLTPLGGDVSAQEILLSGVTNEQGTARGSRGEVEGSHPPVCRRLADSASPESSAGVGGDSGAPPSLPAGRARAGSRGSGAGAGRGGVRGAWIRWLAPYFGDNGSAYFTGTYCDDYGYSNGLMLARNVHKDVRRFISEVGWDDRDFICGVEQHKYRDILHWHGIIQGDFTDFELAYLEGIWEAKRGFARVLPVLDGCTSYVTKYALKGDTDHFEWRLECSR